MGSGSSSARSRAPIPIPERENSPPAKPTSQPPRTGGQAQTAGTHGAGSPPTSKEGTGESPAQTSDQNGPSTCEQPVADGGSQVLPDGQSPNDASQSPAQPPSVPAPITAEPATNGPTQAPDPLEVTPAAEPKPQKDTDTKNDQIIAQCSEFLKRATATGGKTARFSPGDSAAFDQNSDARRDLRPKFLESLQQLQTTEVYSDNCAMENLLTVCKMSDITDPETADDLAERGYSTLFVNIWKAVYHEDIFTSKELHRQHVVYNLIKQASISFTHVSVRLCAEMGSADSGIVPLLAKEFEHPLMTLDALKGGVKKAIWDVPRETLKKTVNILANIIRGNIDSKPTFREANIVPHLQELLNCRFLIMRAKALFCLVYLINEDENEALNTTSVNIEFVIKILGKCLDEKGHYSEHYTFSAEVVVDGIVYMAGNDSNKVKLVQTGVTPLLINMLKTDSVAEKRTAARAVWKLAFHEDNKKQFKENTTLITVLKELRSKESDPRLLQACETVLWMLDVAMEDGKGTGGSRPTTAKNRPRTAKHSTKPKSDGAGTNDDVEASSPDDDFDDDDFDDDLPHVMISYQWGVQKQMIRVKELLRASGYNVWMDVDDMGGSTLESMASAVERSAVVLICFTEKYKLSPSCRTEAEYTYKLRKPIVPLRLQEDYDPDGWLGIMIGTKLYVDLSKQNTVDEDVSKLRQQLGQRGRVLKEGTATMKSEDLNASGTQKVPSNTQRGPAARRSTNTANALDHTDAKTVSSWTNDQVNSWLAKLGLSGLKNRFDGYTGQRLLGLKTIATEAPDFFYAEIKRDLGFKNLLEVVTFKQALDEII